eukprot:scaffold96094_cov75-Phaeocystis_antarctica.AAC.2
MTSAHACCAENRQARFTQRRHRENLAGFAATLEQGARAVRGKYCEAPRYKARDAGAPSEGWRAELGVALRGPTVVCVPHRRPKVGLRCSRLSGAELPAARGLGRRLLDADLPAVVKTVCEGDEGWGVAHKRESAVARTRRRVGAWAGGAGGGGRGR